MLNSPRDKNECARPRCDPGSELRKGGSWGCRAKFIDTGMEIRTKAYLRVSTGTTLSDHTAHRPCNMRYSYLPHFYNGIRFRLYLISRMQTIRYILRIYMNGISSAYLWTLYLPHMNGFHLPGTWYIYFRIWYNVYKPVNSVCIRKVIRNFWARKSRRQQGGEKPHRHVRRTDKSDRSRSR